MKIETPPPAMRLSVIWMILVALLLGQLAFLFVVLLIIVPKGAQQPGIRQPLMWVDYGMLVVIPIMYGIRQFIFRVSRTPAGIPIQRYYIGNILFWAGCEGVTFGSLVFTAITGALMPEMLIFTVAMCLQIATYPRAADVALE